MLSWITWFEIAGIESFGIIVAILLLKSKNDGGY